MTIRLIPDYLLKQSFQYIPVTQDMEGEVEGAPVDVKKVYYELRKSLMRNQSGDTITIDGKIWFNGDRQGIEENNRAKVNGRTYTIFDVQEYLDPFQTNVVHHTEIKLKEVVD